MSEPEVAVEVLAGKRGRLPSFAISFTMATWTERHQLLNRWSYGRMR